MEDGGKKKRFGLSLKSSKKPASNNGKNPSFGEYFTKLSKELDGHFEENKEDNRLCISDTRMKLLDLMPVFPDWRKIKPLPLNPRMIKSLSNPKKVDSNQSNCEMDGKSEKIELNNNDTTKPLNNDKYKALPKLSMQYFTHKTRQQSVVTLDNSREDGMETDSGRDSKPRHKLTEGHKYDTKSVVDRREPDSKRMVDGREPISRSRIEKRSEGKNMLVMVPPVDTGMSGLNSKPRHKLTEGHKHDTKSVVDGREPDSKRKVDSQVNSQVNSQVASGMSGFDSKPRHKPLTEGYDANCINTVEGEPISKSKVEGEPNSRSKVERRSVDIGGVKYSQSKNTLAMDPPVVTGMSGFDPKHKLAGDANSAVDGREPDLKRKVEKPKGLKHADIKGVRYSQSKSVLVEEEVLSKATQNDCGSVPVGGVTEYYPELTQAKDFSDGLSVNPTNREVSLESSEKIFSRISSGAVKSDEMHSETNLVTRPKKSRKTEMGSMKHNREQLSQSLVVFKNNFENPTDSCGKNSRQSSGLFKDGEPSKHSVDYSSQSFSRPKMFENSSKKKTEFAKYDKNDSAVCQIVLSDDDEQEMESMETIQLHEKKSPGSSYVVGQTLAKKADNTNGESPKRPFEAFDDKRTPSRKDGNLSSVVSVNVDKRTSVPVHRKGQGSPRSPLIIDDGTKKKCAVKFNGSKSSQSPQLFDETEREPTKDTKSKSGKSISSIEKFKCNAQWETDYMTPKGPNMSGRYTERETNPQMKNRGGFQSKSKNTLSESSKGAAVRTGVSNNVTRTYSAGIRTEEKSFDSVGKSPYTSIPYKKGLNSTNQITHGKDDGGILEGGWGTYKGTEDKSEDQWLIEELLKEDDDVDDLLSSLDNDLDDDDLVLCCDNLMSPIIPVRDNKSVSRKPHSSMKADTHISGYSKGVKRRLELPEDQSKIKRANRGASNIVNDPGLASTRCSTLQTKNNPGGNSLSECPICMERLQFGLSKQDIDKHIGACLGGEEMVNDDDESFW